MRIEFSYAAELEMFEAIVWYDKQSDGLGDEFLIEVQRAVARIGSFPNAWSKVARRSRRCQLNRFPFGVIYQVRRAKDLIYILAVVHLHRHPKIWQDRE